ncbi:hypothetical protein TRFO_05398 [Tritrichomonas foetus]|uniref:Uncharacterized protein n=1 Tax=Tritrichomonas foetus TaxID=1144522 RepID=A0A1J4KAK8_9EUKA|nr:hypothetical protein TRFO_05398 [Tritrichomonas foetus]|eukprot:OHT06732.1 hypothetical protein TRFO_05398 [Tritrichomonas foetus]
MPKILDKDQEEFNDKSFFARAAKIEKLTNELLHIHHLQGIPDERKKYIHLILGYEPGLELTFDPSLVEHPNTFADKVEKNFQKQVKKGVAKPITHQIYRRPVTKKKKKTQEQKEANYSWIPLSEIHTARTRIDSFVHISPEERKELHQKFATLVVNLISQFDSIGKVDDAHITQDQAASLTTAFSKALVEIQNDLFQPIIRKHTLIKRGPLFNPKKAFDGRSVRHRTPQTLSEFSQKLIKKPTDDNVSSQEMRALSQKNDEDEKSVFPPQYRPDPNFKVPKTSRETFNQIAARIKDEMLEQENRRKMEMMRPKTPVPKRRHVEVIATPRKVTQKTPTLIKKKNIRPKTPTMHFKQIRNPENDFFNTADVTLAPIAGVETGACLEGIERLFAPMKPVQKVVETKEEIAYDPLMMPDKEQEIDDMSGRHYLFKPKFETVSGLMNVNDLFVIDKNQPTEEHEKLVSLWDELGLHPDTRLLMAAKLCTLCANDINSDYHFHAIMNSTKVLEEYQKRYKEYKHVLSYEPNIVDEENKGKLDELSTKFKIAEAAFIQANNEMTMILGSEINTMRGTVTELIALRSKKISKLRYNAGIDKMKRDD